MSEEIGSSVSKVTVEKLNHENYETWSFRMMMLLIDRDLWDIVEGTDIISITASEEEKLRYERRKRKALAQIGLHVGDEYLPHIVKAKYPYQLWNDLKKFNNQRTQSHRVYLRRTLQNISMKKKETIAEYIQRAKIISNKLREAGYLLEEDEIICAILNGLPKDYDLIVTVMENQKELVTIENLSFK